MIMFFNLSALAQTDSIPFSASGTFTVPHGVTSIQVQVWGGGGGGGFNNNPNANRPGGGGGGGGFSQSNNFAVTPGENIPFTIGIGGLGATTTIAINGSPSVFGSLIGNGGVGGQGGNGGLGGTSTGGIINSAGGNGASASGANNGGGGGGAAGNLTAIGGAGQGTNNGIGGAGGGGINGGGSGGNGGDNNFSGINGIVPGGGGGGEGGNGTRGGNGGNGRIVVTWTCPSPVLTSGIGSNSQTVCIGTPINNITYVIGGAYDVTFSGLPDGVTGIYNNGNVTLSGTPTVGGTFPYTITPVDGCEINMVYGSISVTPDNTAGTITQNTFCAGSPLPNDVFQPTTGATGLGTPTGLPAGVSVQLISNEIVFTGTPTQSGSFPYSIPLTGGCGNVFATGTLIINDVAVVDNPALAGQTVCVGSPFTPISINTGFGFTYQWYLNTSASNTGGTAIAAAISEIYLPTSGTVGTSYYYVEVSGVCGNVVKSPVSGALVVIPGNTASASSGSPTVCINQPIPNINHTTTGATGIGTPIGLPSGVNAIWNAGGITISGTPSQSGLFNYSIPLTGGCGTASATGTITVNALPAITSQNTPTQAVCINSAFGELSIPQETGLTYQWFRNTNALNTGGTSIPGATSVTFIPPANTVGTLYYYVQVSGACGLPVPSEVSGAQVVYPLPIIAFDSQPSGSFCVDVDVVYTTQPGQSNYVWTLPGVAGTDYTISAGGGQSDNSITVRWLTPGSKSLAVKYTNGNGCTAASPVSSNNLTIQRNTFSASIPTLPSVCVNTELSAVTINTTLATGIGTPTGLPPGVTVSFSGNSISIGGTPTTAGTFNYSIPLTGGCGTVNATGTLVVTPVYEIRTTTSVSPSFGGGAASITIRGDVASLPNGAYTVTYQLGLANSGGPFTTTVNVVNGIGTFNSVAIINEDLTSLEILSLRRPTDSCTVPISERNITFFGVCAAVYEEDGLFYVPAGITDITVKVWGGGGKGGNSTNSAGGGGGGGGGYSISTISVAPGQTVRVVVGDGGNTASPVGGVSFVTKSELNDLNLASVYADGGNPGSAGSVGVGGTGNGENGFDGTLNQGNLSNGGNGGRGGGNGGLGGSGAQGSGNDNNSTPGLVRGGGGGGARGNGRIGANGGKGLVIISYSCPPISPDKCFEVVDDGAKTGNTIIKFTCAENEWIAPTGLLDFTVVSIGGGGGGGMGNTGGGGGAGGLSSSTVFTNNPIGMEANTTFNIKVGQGGVGADNMSTRGTSGDSSVVSGNVDGNSINVSSPGGGGGGSFNASNPANGGAGASGGGGAFYNSSPNYQGAGGAGTAGMGFNGGIGGAKEFDNDPNKGAASGGGGGGAGGPGGTGTANGAGTAFGGIGGNGMVYNLFGTLIRYGGGGGGIGYNFNGNPENPGLGGIAGGVRVGGDGSASGAGLPGLPETGSGGGAGPGGGGQGGSGVVFIVYENFRILPVEYIFIKAEYLHEDRLAEITWATAKEWENSHFEVERSFQNINNWEAVGKVDGMGYSDEPAYYNFEDKNLPLTGGTVYYRLKQVGFSGKMDYSKVLSVRIPALQFTQGVWRAYPNPTDGEQLRISLMDRNQYDDEPITFRIIHPMSQTVDKSVRNESEMNEILSQVAKRVPRGVFVVEIKWGQKIEHIKVLKK